MEKIADITAVVLAGGKSERMGRDKAELLLAGQTLLEHVVRRAEAVFSHVLIAGGKKERMSTWPVVQDELENFGPLAGIRAGLRTAFTDWIFVLPCDSPFVPETFLRGLAGLRDESAVVVPRLGALFEPLHALYSRRCLPALEEIIARGERQIVRLYELVPVKVVEGETLRQWDPPGLAFFNINTPADLAHAEEILRSLSG